MMDRDDFLEELEIIAGLFKNMQKILTELETAVDKLYLFYEGDYGKSNTIDNK